MSKFYCSTEKRMCQLLAHRPPSTFAQFSLFVTDQRKSAQLVIRSVGHIMSLLSHDLQSTMILDQ